MQKMPHHQPKCSVSEQSPVEELINSLIREHSEGRGARYTRTRIPLKIIYQESCFNRSEALVRECAVKALSRKQKENLLKQKVKVVYNRSVPRRTDL